MTWLDVVLLVLLAVLTVRGLLRGTIAQVFAFLGMAAGAWAFVLVAAWLGDHWQGAKPAAVYFTLRWLVATLVALAVAAVFEWLGGTIAKAAHEGPFGWADRLGGGVIGAAMGVAIAALVVLVMVQGPVALATGRVGERSGYTKPLLREGERVTRLLDSRVPGGTWLHRRFVEAAARQGGAARPAGVAPAR
jgi:uncharacterized membrane protein required for colicin V production